MNILFVSAVLPYPLYSGGQIRIYNLLKQLGTSHDITLAAFVRDKKEESYRGNMPFVKEVFPVYRGRAWRPSYLAAAIGGFYPLLWASYQNSAMRELLADLMHREAFDLIHIEPGYVWPSMPSTATPIVVTEHNIEHEIYEEFVRRFPIAPMRPFLSWDIIKMKWWEKRIWKRATGVVAVSQEDQTRIAQATGRSDIAIVPNGVDAHAFPFQRKRASKYPTYLFVGNFSWLQNRDAVTHLLQKIWPLIHAVIPQATLRIVGKNSSNEVRRLANSTGVVLLEQVDAIQEEFACADVLLAPIRMGGGTKFKILEAIASGVAVVTTSVGAKGLAFTRGKEIIEADDDTGFVLEAVRLGMHGKVRGEIVRLGRKKIDALYTWDRIAASLDSVWRTYEQKHH